MSRTPGRWMSRSSAVDRPAAKDAHLRSIFPKAPALKKLERHIRLYGTECVAKAMAAYGVKELPLVAYATKTLEGRRMTPELRQLIHDLEG